MVPQARLLECPTRRPDAGPARAPNHEDPSTREQRPLSPAGSAAASGAAGCPRLRRRTKRSNGRRCRRNSKTDLTVPASSLPAPGRASSRRRHLCRRRGRSRATPPRRRARTGASASRSVRASDWRERYGLGYSSFLPAAEPRKLNVNSALPLLTQAVTAVAPAKIV